MKVYTLKLDIDSKSKRVKSEIAKRMVFLQKFLGNKSFKIKEVETKKGYHIEITFKPKIDLDDKDLVFMQLLLLSDWKRELLNWVRVKNNLKNWNVLFNKKFRMKNGKLKLVSEEVRR